MFPWSFLAKFLQHRGAASLAALIALLLCLPSLRYGLQLDDLIHRCALVDVEGFTQARRPPSELFSFVDGDPEHRRASVDGGFLPWWSAPDLKLTFLRPITGLTHWLDHNMFGQSTALMRTQSAVWYALLVLAVGLFYRRMMGVGVAAGIAVLLYAIDDAHGLPATWLANRNAVIAGFFGALTLLLHDAWRRQGANRGAWLAPVAFLLALLSGEIAVSVAAYLLAYALFLDRSTGVARFLSLVPAAAVSLAWLVYYKASGYGAAHSGLYIDPFAEPLQFLVAAAVRGPLMLWTQWMTPPAEMYYMLPARSATFVAWVAIAFVPALAVLLWPLLRTDRIARFWATGMVLSVPPACVMLASNRLLVFIGLGGFGLLAQWLAKGLAGGGEQDREAGRSRMARVLALWFAVVHLILAPIVFLLAAPMMEQFSQVALRAARSLPTDATDQTVLIVQTPTAFLSGAGPVFAASEGRVIPERTLVLGSSIYPIEVSRRDEATLILRPEHGFLAPGGLAHAGFDRRPVPSLAPNQMYMLAPFDELFRDPTDRFFPGQRIELERLSVEILSVTSDGRPAEVAFVLPTSLENGSLRWVRWHGGVYVPFRLPEIGESVTLRLRVDPEPSATAAPAS